jgi:hypothetical protein
MYLARRWARMARSNEMDISGATRFSSSQAKTERDRNNAKHNNIYGPKQKRG